jgi:hypothetical protein
MMRSSQTRSLLMILLLGVSAYLCSCSEDGPSDVDEPTDCIGNEGGSVAVADTSDFLYGVSFSVAPGDWQECWFVYLWYVSTFSTPNFPDGIEGYEGWLTGSVELEIGRGVENQWVEAPDSLDFEMTFPRRGLTEELGEKLMAFRFDEEAGIYRLAVPVRLDDQSLTVRGHHTRQLWTWGKVYLDEVDFDTYLAPAMAELHGEGAWLEIQAELERLQEEALAGQHAITCEALDIARGALLAAGEVAADNVREIQDALHGACGTCDATTEVFYDELSEYLKLQVGYYITDLFLGESRNILIKIYGFIMCSYMQYCIEQLDCDFECFAGAVNVDFYIQLGLYYACTVMVELIDWAMISGFIDCP